MKVLTLGKNPMLMWQHGTVVQDLYDELGITSASEFAWNPHVTIGDVDTLPERVYLGDLEVW